MMAKSSDHPSHPVKNGLLLRRAGQDLPFKSYTYCPSRPLASGVGSIEWCPLSFFHLEGAHIRLYNLRQDGLTGIIEECSKSRPRALVIVNEKDSLKLNQDQSELLQDFDDCLVVILSSSAGSNLLGLEDLDDVEAKINVTSSTNTQLVVDDVGVDVIDMDTAVPSSTSGRAEHQNKGFMNKLFGGSKTATFDLKGEIKKLMFEGDKMKPVTLDAGLFTVIMSSFSQYEKTPKPDSNQISFIIRQYLVACVDVSFYAEFPFYLMVIYRFRHYRSHYQSEDVGPLTTKCINMFKSLSPDQITKTLSKFFKQKDFDIMYDEVNTSVFQLLAISCRDLLNTSIQIKNAQPNQSSGGVIYARLLWISVYLKCLSEKGVATPHEGEIWQDFLLKESMVKNILLTKELIEEFMKGLEFSAMLNLPQEVKFTSHHMTNFLGREKFIRPFCQVKDFIVTLETYIKNDRELVAHVLINLRSFYTQFLNSSDPQEICKASENGTILGVIDEGISFLDAMTELWHKRRWHKGDMNDNFRQVCLKWLNLLLSIIKVTDPNAPQLLKKFLAQKMNSIISDKEFRNHITAD
jgi:hypothetical protein